MTASILIVDDDPLQARLLETMIRSFGYDVDVAHSGESAWERLQAGSVALVIVDLVMPDLDGLGLLARMRTHEISVPTIVQISPSGVDAVSSVLRAGALDFIIKPVGPERLVVTIKNALRLRMLEEVLGLAPCGVERLSFRNIYAGSEAMSRVLHLTERATKTTLPVLIEGEAGTGKTHIARAIHNGSSRRSKAFVCLNCRTMPAESFEAVLLGCAKAAVGKWEEANGGTLLLKNVEDLPLSVQEKLLRILQTGEILPFGARRPVKTHVRLMSTARSHLINRVKSGHFREDLFYSLNVSPMTLPPLRSRREDIPHLIDMFMMRFAAEEGKRLRGVSTSAMALLVRYDWPGNVRQLENVLFRAVVLAETDELTVAEFPQIAARVEGFDVYIPPILGSARLPPFVPPAVNKDPQAIHLLDNHGDMRTLADIEAEALRFAFHNYQAHMSLMARQLGIGRSTLYRKLRELGISTSHCDEEAA